MEHRFILITAAKNEQDYIAIAMESVVRQTQRPIAWFIMDDGSTDRTADIVKEYSERYPFIHLVSA